MYIERIHNWTDADWNKFFLQYPTLNKEGQSNVKQILTLPNKGGIESHFTELEKYGIINGIGPGYFIKTTRKIISWLFKGVKYEWHDIMYAIGGTEKNRLDADYGLLKYSKMTILIGIIKARMDFNPISMILYYIASGVQLFLAYFCYIMVVIFGRFGSFRYIKKIKGI